ncbi:hypothetical protein RA086_05510 [Lactiplantibacillus sp. WILCCON 0030]|uniref:Uncharacterized protein n=1 Tax=Lactiplantibacillus brownii TaxID=3069269 RepID=A0ABU1A7Z9_9LACO|nr:hypothetical protein [Lactiplantibacillus brownii]MDQ7937084.1 hypothetical protein [Lactiplantibacillus brownii]
MSPSEWDGFAEEYLENKRCACTVMNQINEMNNVNFIDYVLKGNRNLLNGIVPAFPAYDIAARIKNNGWQLTLKQRHAITNVYLFSNYGLKQEDLD